MSYNGNRKCIQILAMTHLAIDYQQVPGHHPHKDTGKLPYQITKDVTVEMTACEVEDILARLVDMLVAVQNLLVGLAQFQCIRHWMCFCLLNWTEHLSPWLLCDTGWPYRIVKNSCEWSGQTLYFIKWSYSCKFNLTVCKLHSFKKICALLNYSSCAIRHTVFVIAVVLVTPCRSSHLATIIAHRAWWS